MHTKSPGNPWPVGYYTGYCPQVPDPVIEQFEPTRGVLWRRWRGTMLEDTWGATLINMAVALMVCIVFRRLESTNTNLSEQLVKIDM